MLILGSSVSSAPAERVRSTLAVEFDDAWAIDAMFGGAVATGCVAAARQVCGEPDLAAVSVSMRYLAPTPPGPATLVIDVLRAGRRFTTVSCEVVVAGRVTATALITLAPASSLATVGSADGANPPGLPAAADMGGSLSAVAQRVDWRTGINWRGGERRKGDFVSWVRLRDETADPLDPTRFLVAADLIGPALAASGLELPFRVATVTLDVITIARTAAVWLEQRIRVLTTGTDAGAGAVADLRLTTPDGQVVATALQRAAILPALDTELPFSVTGFGWGRP
jgi:acyl-CoA thioesterase